MGRVSEAAALTIQTWGRRVNAKKVLLEQQQRRIHEEEEAALEEMERQQRAAFAATRRHKRRVMRGRVAIVSVLAVTMAAIGTVAFVSTSSKDGNRRLVANVRGNTMDHLEIGVKTEPKSEEGHLFAGGSETLTRLASSFISEQMSVKHTLKNVEALDYV